MGPAAANWCSHRALGDDPGGRAPSRAFLWEWYEQRLGTVVVVATAFPGRDLGGDWSAPAADLDAAATRSTGALAQSLIRLIEGNLIYRDDHGVYAYTAPMFGDFMRRCHQRPEEDGVA